MSFDGKTPPSDLGAEQAVLSAALLDTQAASQMADLLRDGDFYSEAHRRVCEAIRVLVDRDEQIDSVMVAKELHARGRLEQVGGVAYIASLLGAAPAITSKAVEAYATRVRECALRRELIQIALRAGSAAYLGDHDVFGLLDETERKIHELAQANVRASSLTTMRAAVTKTFQRLKEHEARGGGIMGHSTGFAELDDALGGLQPGDLTIVAARPGMGKTSLVMSLAANQARAGRGALVFSLEMPDEQIAMRTLSSEGRVNLGSIRNGRITPDEWKRLAGAASDICKSPHFYLDDGGGTTIADIRSKARKVQRDVERAGTKLGVIAVDYIQLVSNRGENREQAIAEISRTLKALAKELRVPVLGLSQLNRQVEQRADKRPMISDLRESGAIEQDADNILLLYRDDYYNKDSDAKGVCEVIIGKQRNGATGTIELGFREETVTFHSRMQDAPSHWSDPDRPEVER